MIVVTPVKVFFSSCGFCKKFVASITKSAIPPTHKIFPVFCPLVGRNPFANVQSQAPKVTIHVGILLHLSGDSDVDVGSESAQHKADDASDD